ncbi:MAG TPA: histidine kinase dimerization/phospho-acceptor domain-containing protein [Gemmatimonadaceae bacterium]|nr:histidine kinase dimerization/phospho-acceptor domain-containing protein [Gemmatimonadaceae bacterium]
MSELPKAIEERVQHLLPPNLLHDLRTPLGHILGYSELMIEQMQASGNQEFIPYLEKIRTAGHQLLDMLKDNFSSGPESSVAPTAALQSRRDADASG